MDGERAAPPPELQTSRARRVCMRSIQVVAVRALPASVRRAL